MCACEGAARLELSDPAVSPRPPTTPTTTASEIVCDPATAGVPSPPLRRLSVAAYTNTLRAVIEAGLGDRALADEARLEVAPELASLPVDARPELDGEFRGTFRRLDQVIQATWVEAVYRVAARAGAVLTQAKYYSKLVPCAAQAGSVPATCIDGFIRRFGERALRAPLDEAQVTFYKGVYGDTSRLDPLAFADVVGALLSAPQFLYLMEHGEGAATTGAPTTYALGPYELASRLAYHFWNAPPDDALLEAARTGALTTEEGYRAQVDRLFADPRARPVLDAFYAEWLLLDDLPAFENQRTVPGFDTFAGANLPSANLRTAMVAEISAMARYFTWTQAGTFDDLLTTDLAFVTNAELASLYGLAAPWSGQGLPPAFRPGARPGLVTRAALLASENMRTRPILRGVKTRMKLLCDVVPPPPADADMVAADKREQLPETPTAREETEFVTESSAACLSCHRSLINPLGFALEGFDTLGRERSSEQIFAEDGRLLATKPVSTRTEPRVFPDDHAAASTPGELVELIKDSGKAHTCFARQYVRYAFGTVEKAERDGCLIADLSAALRAGTSLAEAMKSLAHHPSFKTRDFGATP
jgi:hypothetical protein